MKFIRYYLLYIKNNNYITIIKWIFIGWTILLAIFQQKYIIEHQKSHWGYQLLSASIHCCATLITIKISFASYKLPDQYGTIQIMN